ncbi:hypothetical protein B5F86_10115 [Lachnoclostridium sp. An298]|nr:hypothetical protein B5F86_10115 [Lachnoclostridium sp. An298]
MSPVYSLSDFLKMLYPDSNIPSYLYRFSEQNIVHAEPEQSTLTYPPGKYLSRLLESSGHIAYLSTEYGSYFGCISSDADPDIRIIFGPVTLTPYSDSELHQMYIDYVVPQESRREFSDFFQRVPQFSLNSFLVKLAFINYCLNGEMLSAQELLPQQNIGADSMADTLYEKRSDSVHNYSHEIESVIHEIIRTGRPEALSRVKFNESLANIGITGPTALRQIKNNIIVSTTLSTRAAIDGGLDTDVAYQLSDSFIQTAESLSDPDALYELMGRVIYTFAERVKEAQMPVSTDGMIQNAIRFIQQNVCEHITVTDVAEHVGFSRSYFSTYFKKELGFSVNAFIMRCKMEEAKQLLKYTDKSVSVISSYLCFSSQSHFQSAFKKQYGMTPLQYRKNPDYMKNG